eukprot:3657851-Heterocapsa_arctica.AAC.1
MGSWSAPSWGRLPVPARRGWAIVGGLRRGCPSSPGVLGGGRWRPPWWVNAEVCLLVVRARS